MSGSTSVCEIRVPAAIDRVAVERWREALANVGGAGVVVLRGDERSFCRGLDLHGVLGATAEDRRAAVHGFARGLLELRRLPCATLAVVRGDVRGGGLGIVAACDVVLAGPHASFSLPEALFGLTPAIVGPFVEERVGAAVLRRLILTASTLRSEEAARIGLVDDTVEQTAIERRSRQLVRALGRTAGTAAETKREGGPTVSDVEAAAETTLSRLADSHIAERIRAFVEDGAAPWEVSA